MSKLYEMPEVKVGDVVLWSHSPRDRDKVPAVVTKVHKRAVTLSLVVAESPVLALKDGAKHCEDPDRMKTIGQGDGYWEHTQRTKDFLAMRELLASLNDSPPTKPE
ncbi:MAG: hypothetical protein IRY99_07915 [Isosphaeraceae bacterium]|nr:hypothetical protein [Isosphaeraceae bacterium]